MNVIDLLKNHTSIRQYKADKIEKGLLTSILEAGCRASTTGNMQLYSIIVTENDENKQALAPLHFSQKPVLEAPVVLTICADFNRFNEWCLLRNATPGYDNFLSFMNGAVDAILVAQNITIAAESVGLGVCYFGTVLYNANKIIEVLKLPKGVVPVATITLGYPAMVPAQVDRLPLEAVVHYEAYNNYTHEMIEEIYSNKESLAENVAFVRDNNKESLAQVFTDVRYKKADNEFFSKGLLDVLRQQGFLDV